MSDMDIGCSVDAGLPNITGYVGTHAEQSSGVFYSVNPGHSTLHNIYTNPWGLYFDASRCSAIYGNSESVNPTSLTTGWFIKF